MKSAKPLLRKDVPLKSTWNREIVYGSWDAWQADYDSALSELSQLQAFAGKLGQDSLQLVYWFKEYKRQWRRLFKLYGYTRMAYVVDTSDEEVRGPYGQVISLYAQFAAAISFAAPELIDLGEILLAWSEENPELKIYKHYFEDLLRQKSHRRSAEVEELLGQLEESFSGPGRTADEMTNTDMKFVDAIDKQGNVHPVYQSTITPHGIQSSDRERRRTAWESFYDAHLALQNSLASNYITSVQQHVFLARARDYDSVLHMQLSRGNLPVEVFHNIISTFKKNLSVWHRYWEVKRKILGVKEFRPYDVWAPIVKEQPRIPYTQAVNWICEALSPLGEEYVSVLRRGCLEERWVDYAPNVGKMQGAASWLRVDTPPFIYMSYDQTIMSMSVLAHELGHSMHHYFTDEKQPEVYNFEAISSSVSETASNFNQALLRAFLMREKQNDTTFQIALLDEMIFNFHRYFFTMPTLSRFEYEIFSQAEANKPLTTQFLNETMAKLFSEAYGTTLTDDPARTAITWAQFGHLFSPYYTFQYAVGISAANALADGVLANQSGAAEQYLKFLGAGGSKYAIDLFQLAGVDMATEEPVEKAFAVLSNAVDQLERLAT